jgi:hypothetical protein
VRVDVARGEDAAGGGTTQGPLAVAARGPWLTRRQGGGEAGPARKGAGAGGHMGGMRTASMR